jgi:hypothetical protein
MLPFCGYNMADYYSHWLKMGSAADKPVPIFMVNWFRMNEKGEFAWPGFGDNARVLKWIIERCEGKVAGQETVLGWMPNYEDIDWSGADFSKEEFAGVTSLDKQAWLSELEGVKDWFGKMGDKLPAKLADIRDKFEKEFQASLSIRNIKRPPAGGFFSPASWLVVKLPASPPAIPTMPTFPASRLADIAPFHVMELMARAKALEAEGRDIIHMEVGEPDFPTPEPIVAAARAASPAATCSIHPRSACPNCAGPSPTSTRCATASASRPRASSSPPALPGGLLLAIACLTEPGSEWLLTDPGYPCNRHFVRSFEGVPIGIPVGPASNFQPTLADLEAHWNERTAGALFASPANPTGTLLADERWPRSPNSFASARDN